MDPNACLAEIRRLLADDSADRERLADLMEGLDNWLSKGGFLPLAWSGRRYSDEREPSLRAGVEDLLAIAAENEAHIMRGLVRACWRRLPHHDQVAIIEAHAQELGLGEREQEEG